MTSRRRQLARRIARRLPPRTRSALSRLVQQGLVPRPVRVSVVIATYNSPAEGLARVMKSINRQTMHPRSIELVFVDDGSTDDTVERLTAIARRRVNVVVHSIPNSGWASRPRNVGVGLARGEYVLFMDHDDELLPSGLQRAYDFGRQHQADVVNAKEVRTTGWSWGWGAFTDDVGHAAYVDPNPLIPMTPHKLYRRAFLLENDVRFPEGARVLWEDIYFNTLAYARGARVAVESTYPLYHWVLGAQNTSKTFGRDADEFWSNLAQVLDYIDTHLAGMPAREPLLLHHLRARVLSFVGPNSLNRPEDYYAIAYGHARELVAKYAPATVDATLSAVDRCRLELLRLGRIDRQRRLAEYDRGITAVPTIKSVEWEGSELAFTVETTLVDAAGAPLRLRRAGDRWLRDLPPELGDALSEAALDVSADLGRATFEVSVRGRSSRSTWPVAGVGTVTCQDDGSGYGTVTASVTARFDPRRFAADHDLDDPVWDFAGRLAVLGHVAHRGLRGGRTLTGLLNGVPAVGYVNRDGIYSLDVAAAVRTVTGSAGITVADARVEAHPENDGAAVEVTISLPAVHCVGTTNLRGEMLIGPDQRVPVRLVGGAGAGPATLQFSAVVPPGRHALRSRLAGRTGNTGLVLDVGTGPGTVVAVEETAPAKR